MQGYFAPSQRAEAAMSGIFDSFEFAPPCAATNQTVEQKMSRDQAQVAGAMMMLDCNRAPSRSAPSLAPVQDVSR
jgi:hypothetical protein